jgi:hypothetical protein
VNSPISLADHCTTVVSVDFSTSYGTLPVTKHIWRFSEVYVDGLNATVSAYSWDVIVNLDNIENATSSFITALNDLFLDYIPHHDKLSKSKDMPWFHGGIKRAINRRNKMYRKMVKSQSDVNNRNYKESARQVSNLVTTSKKNYHNRLCNSLDTNSSRSKNYWLIIKQLLCKMFCSGIIRKIGPLLTCPKNRSKNNRQ